MLYVSVLLASFYHSLLIPLSRTRTHAFILSPHAQLRFLPIPYFLAFYLCCLLLSFSLSLSRYSHDRLCNVLANMRSTRYSVVLSDTEVVSNC